jgi:hypothetical protein
MKSLARCLTIAILAAIPHCLSAQWPSFKTPGIPRTAEGKPDLEAPTPKTADGHTDLSGIWEFTRPRLAPGEAPPTPPPAAGPAPGSTAGGGLGARPPGPNQFFDIGSTVKGGLPFQPWALDIRKQRMAGNNKDNPDAHCLPLGLMQLHTHPQPRQMVQTPRDIVVMYEANAGLRHIYMDGRGLPPKDVEPWWYGYSIGHWDGDTLVVETTGFRDDVWLDVEGSPLTNTGKMTERFRRPNFGSLEIEITVEDPKAYTKPWTVLIRQKIMVDAELIEFVCVDRDASHYVGK